MRCLNGKEAESGSIAPFKPLFRLCAYVAMPLILLMKTAPCFFCATPSHSHVSAKSKRVRVSGLCHTQRKRISLKKEKGKDFLLKGKEFLLKRKRISFKKEMNFF